MKLTEKLLQKIIYETQQQLFLLGALEVENNFVKSNNIQLDEEEFPDACPEEEKPIITIRIKR